MQSKIKRHVQGTNSDRKETRTQINGLEQKEERNICLLYTSDAADDANVV